MGKQARPQYVARMSAHRSSVVRNDARSGAWARPGRLYAAVGRVGLLVGLGALGCSSGGYQEMDRSKADQGSVRTDAAPPEDLRSDGSGDGGSGRDGGGVRDGGGTDGSTAPDLSMTTPTTDPFEPASCDGPALSASAATAMLGASARLKLADATLYKRTRTCTGTTPATCGAWTAPVPHTQALLTYSGGVTTDYKTFSFPTHLLLFAQAGQPKLVIRHESDYRKYASENTRGVVFPFGADPMLNTYPVIYVWDFAPAPNRYEDLRGLLADKGQLHASDHCARAVFTDGLKLEIAALYRY